MQQQLYCYADPFLLYESDRWQVLKYCSFNKFVLKMWDI